MIHIGVDGMDGRPLPQRAKAGNHLVDAVGCITHATQRVGAERRIVEVDGQVLEHQVERGGGVLQVVDEER